MCSKREGDTTVTLKVWLLLVSRITILIQTWGNIGGGEVYFQWYRLSCVLKCTLALFKSGVLIHRDMRMSVTEEVFIFIDL